MSRMFCFTRFQPFRPSLDTPFTSFTTLSIAFNLERALPQAPSATPRLSAATSYCSCSAVLACRQGSAEEATGPCDVVSCLHVGFDFLLCAHSRQLLGIL